MLHIQISATRHTNTWKFLSRQLSCTHTKAHLAALPGGFEPLHPPVLLYLFCHESKFLKIDTCRNEHLFSPSVPYANEANEYSDRTQFRGTRPQACFQLVERIMWTSGTGEGGGNKSSYPCSPPSSFFFLFSVSGHMLNESSANLEQFMSRQTRRLSSSTPRDVWATRPVVSSPSRLSLSLIFSFLTFHLHFRPLLSSSPSALQCFPFFVSTVFNHFQFSLCLFLLPSHFISIFPPPLAFSLQRGHHMNNSSVAGW